MNVVIISQCGEVQYVYTEQAFLEEVNKYSEEKITDIDKAIDVYVDEAFADDYLTLDVMEVIE